MNLSTHHTQTHRRSQPSPQPDRWMKAKDVAFACRISLSTVRKLSMLPDCPIIRPPGVRAVLFDLVEFREWLKEGSWKQGRSVVREVRDHG